MSFIDVKGRAPKKYKILAKEVAENVILAMNYPKGLEIAIDFVFKKEIKSLNNDFRQIDKVTDVLSFPSFEILVGDVIDVEADEIKVFKQDNGFVHFGDMALCLKQTKRQAKEFGVSVEFEIKKLVIHSMLHLMGYDHIKDSDYEIMKKEEERLEKII